eukprot:scaffold309191_cov22-Tisochrysis_lutea.AAC.1
MRVYGERTSGKSTWGSVGDTKVYLTITPEDELYARTIRTVHLIVRRQLSLNDTYHVLELQSANGSVVSYDHIGLGGGIESSGLPTWLHCGALVFSRRARERASSLSERG